MLKLLRIDSSGRSEMQYEAFAFSDALARIVLLPA